MKITIDNISLENTKKVIDLLIEINKDKYAMEQTKLELLEE